MSSKPHPEELEPLILEPCQFCGSNRVEIYFCQKDTPRPLAKDVWIGCRACGASGPVAGTPETAVEWWNLGKPQSKESKS